MKKIFCIFMAIALCLCMCACGGPSSTYQDRTLFERVVVFDDCCIYRHIDTNVLYVYYSGGCFSVMFNADGTPMIWSDTKMLKATEAWTITKKCDKYAEQLAQIEVVIRDEAERGGACTWWYCENMTDYERKILAKRLEEFGYTITVGKEKIYINWRNASKE